MTTITALPPLPPGDYARRQKRQADIPYWFAPPGYCRWCGQDLGSRLADSRPDPRHRWHSACVTTWQQTSSQGAVREAVWRRDNGLCVDCPPGAPRWPHNTVWRHPCGEMGHGPECRLTRRHALHARYAEKFGRVCLIRPHDCGRAVRVGWEADHVIEIADGGAHVLDNLVTRCIAHHQAKTNESRRRRKAAA